MEFDDIERILELMRQHDLVGVRAGAGRAEARVRKTSSGYAPLAAPMQMPGQRRHCAPSGRHRPPALPEPAGTALEETELELAVVKSPIVGTFYRSPGAWRAVVRRSGATG